jgi:GT2 family glycosyltransferase
MRVTDDQPEISVVVPSYNRARLLPTVFCGLESQTLALNRFEVIVVDDGSDDQTPVVLKGLAERSPMRVRVIRTPNGGAAKARNIGWQASSAPLVGFIDDDCLATPGWLEAGLSMLQAYPALGVVQGQTVVAQGAALGDWTITREVRMASPYFESHNIFYRRAALQQAGGFDESLGLYGEDTALGWAVLEQGWESGFCDGALVSHEVAERGVRWWAWFTYVAERNLVSVAARFPSFRSSAYWRPWAFKQQHAYYALAVTGVVLSFWKRPLSLLVLPYFWARRPPRHHARYVALVAERVAVDTGGFLGRKVGAVRYRRFVI